MKSLLKFIIRYLSIGIIGTAVIALGVSFLKIFYEEFVERRAIVPLNKPLEPHGTSPAGSGGRQPARSAQLAVSEPGQVEKHDYPDNPVNVSSRRQKEEQEQEKKNLLAHEAQLVAEIARIKCELAPVTKSKTQNPYAEEYASAKAVHSRYWKKVRELQKKRDSAADADHVRYSDELQKMKGEDIRLGLALETVEKKYAAWNADHATISTNAELQTLESELESARARLHALETEK